jgi:DNA-binding transcriptional ArsR family regulator
MPVTKNATQCLLDDMLHPVRMRIMTALSGSPGLTPMQLAERLNDVSQATLYRQISRLAKSGILAVLEERPVRGTVEKVYTLNKNASLRIDPQDFATLSKEDHLRYFNAFTVTLLDEFARYLNHTPHIDLVADGVGYTQVVLWMNDEELTDFARAVNQALAPHIVGQEVLGRKKRIFSTIMIPDVSVES